MENGRFAFLSPLGGLEAMYDVHLRLIGKHVLVLTEPFLLRATNEVPRANID